MNQLAGEQSGGDLSGKDILKVAGAVTALVGTWVTYMAFGYDSHPNFKGAGSDSAARLDPDRKAKIISETLGNEGSDPSLLLRQALPDGRIITIRKPVFAGDVLTHQPGDKVFPSELEKPLPPQM